MSSEQGRQKNYIKDAVDLIFKKYDLNKNGLLEEKEVYAMLTDTYASLSMDMEVTEETVQAYLDQIDRNGDRKLSREEIGKMVADMIA
jgi:Ca2+-binding EF-hand superfamily protein